MAYPKRYWLVVIGRGLRDRMQDFVDEPLSEVERHLLAQFNAAHSS